MAACGTPASAPIDLQVDEDGKFDSAKRVSLSAGQTYTFHFKASGDARQVTVDCRPNHQVDSQGMTFSVDASELGTLASDPPRAGYWRAVAELSAGTHEMTINGESGSGSCSVGVSRVTGACTSATSWHSQVTDHTHIAVGTTSRNWETFPASGNHWGAWAKWGEDYAKPVKRGFMLHNMEHGGLVLSYNCSSPTASAACREAHQALVDLKESFGQARVIITPDPTQPARLGIRGWRWAYLADCVDQTKMLTFMDQHYRDGREDEDSDPPIPFDPTTTRVPCQDLMSAPDSCQ
jgi:hypothetical protein